MRRVFRYRSWLGLCVVGSFALWVAGFGPGTRVEAAETAATLKAADGDAATIEVTVSEDDSPGSPSAEPAAPSSRATHADSKSSKTVSQVATHHQAALIEIKVPGQPQATVTCFCLTPDDRILAGCSGQSGEVRVFDREGKYLETWSSPVKPDAIFSRGDGAIFLAGEGQLVKLSSTGSVELKKASPHAAALIEHPEKLRAEVVAQIKQQAQMYEQQTKQFDQMIERADKEIASIKEQIAAIEPSEDASKSDESATDGDDHTNPSKAPKRITVARKKSLEVRITMYERQKVQYKQAKEQWANMAGLNKSGELTDAQIDERVKASMAYKLKVSSISATKDDVFLATPLPAGYGYGIWRMDDQFENGSQIVSGLSGCCGQMDVKANDQGVFVAENSKHHVVRYDRTGKKLGEWGFSSRTGLDGFGSCCNPMNIAFGPENAVYTAEDDTGRIKRYSPEGKLLGLVGLVELKPGCKNVAIAVSSDGSHAYMLDITRNHIVRMDPRSADEIAKEEAKVAASPAKSSGGASGFGEILRAVFSSGE